MMEPVIRIFKGERYIALINQAQPKQGAPQNLCDFLERRPWTGKRTKQDINKQIKAERAS